MIFCLFLFFVCKPNFLHYKISNPLIQSHTFVSSAKIETLVDIFVRAWLLLHRYSTCCNRTVHSEEHGWMFHQQVLHTIDLWKKYPNNNAVNVTQPTFSTTFFSTYFDPIDCTCSHIVDSSDWRIPLADRTIRGQYRADRRRIVRRLQVRAIWWAFLPLAHRNSTL